MVPLTDAPLLYKNRRSRDGRAQKCRYGKTQSSQEIHASTTSTAPHGVPATPTRGGREHERGKRHRRRRPRAARSPDGREPPAALHRQGYRARSQPQRPRVTITRNGEPVKPRLKGLHTLCTPAAHCALYTTVTTTRSPRGAAPDTGPGRG